MICAAQQPFVTLLLYSQVFSIVMDDYRTLACVTLTPYLESSETGSHDDHSSWSLRFI